MIQLKVDHIIMFVVEHKEKRHVLVITPQMEDRIDERDKDFWKKCKWYDWKAKSNKEVHELLCTH